MWQWKIWCSSLHLSKTFLPTDHFAIDVFWLNFFVDTPYKTRICIFIPIPSLVATSNFAPLLKKNYKAIPNKFIGLDNILEICLGEAFYFIILQILLDCGGLKWYYCIWKWNLLARSPFFILSKTPSNFKLPHCQS